MGTNAYKIKTSPPCCVAFVKIIAYIQTRMSRSIFTPAPCLTYLTTVLALASLQWWGYPLRAELFILLTKLPVNKLLLTKLLFLPDRIQVQPV
jgi:hypothetical protein